LSDEQIGQVLDPSQTLFDTRFMNWSEPSQETKTKMTRILNIPRWIS